jgi:putative hydrolase of the HAD superfamily
MSSPHDGPFASLDAILFDYGNTLIEFGPRQLRLVHGAIERYLSDYGTVDREKLETVRDRQLSAPFLNGYRENDLAELCAELLRDVAGVDPTPAQTSALVRLRCESFHACVKVDPSVPALLERLRRRYRLAMVSNYPCGQCVRDSLDKLDMGRLFDVVVVSGDLGLCKPHPKPFETALQALDVEPHRALYVGDNWLCDVQGSKRLGMHSVLISQFVPYQQIEADPNDHQPDARVAHLDELEVLLGCSLV